MDLQSLCRICLQSAEIMSPLNELIIAEKVNLQIVEFLGDIAKINVSDKRRCFIIFRRNLSILKWTNVVKPSCLDLFIARRSCGRSHVQIFIDLTRNNYRDKENSYSVRKIDCL